MRGETGVDEAVGQVLVAVGRYAEPGGLDDVRPGADIVDAQPRRVHALRIPFLHGQAQRLAQQCLAGAEAGKRAGPAGSGRAVATHALDGRLAGKRVDPGIAGLDQVRSIIPVRFNLAGGQKWHD